MRATSSNYFHPSIAWRCEVKSLFPDILPLSPCGSRFCLDSTRSIQSKFLRIRILPNAKEKNCERYPPRSPAASAHRREPLKRPQTRAPQPISTASLARTRMPSEPAPPAHSPICTAQRQRSTIYPCPSKLRFRPLPPFARRAATPSPAKAGSRKRPCACS